MGKLRVLFFLLLISFGVSAQKIQKVNTYGYEYNRFIVDTLFALPGDTFTVPAALQSYPFLAKKGTTLYLWNTSTLVWASVSGGGGGSTPTLQQVLTAGSTVDQDNTISSEGFDFRIQTDFTTANFFNQFFSVAVDNNASEVSALKIYPDSIRVEPDSGKLYIDTLNYTLSTAGKKIMLRDTASGLVQNIDPLLLAQEATNFADTTNFKPVVINTTGTAGTIGKIYKATYWPGGGGDLTWKLNGNTATGSEYIGTNNGFDFVGKVNNAEIFRFKNTNGSLTFGLNSAVALDSSIAIGVNSYNSGNGAVSIGPSAGRGSSGSGTSNIFIGKTAGLNNTGSTTIAIGQSAASNNTANGVTAIGINAGLSNTGANVVFVGMGAGQLNTGLRVVAVGLNAGRNTNAAATDNVLIGYYSGYVSYGGANTFIGNYSGNTGNSDSSIGIGYNSGIGLSQVNAISIGNNSGNGNSGRNVISIGSHTNRTNTYHNVIALGRNASATRDGQLVIGDSVNSFRFKGLSRGVANYVLTDSLGDGTFWVARPASSGGIPLSSITAATGTNTIDNGAYKQEWQWNSLAGTNGFKLSSNSTAAVDGQRFAFISSTGANASSTVTTTALTVSNDHTGTSSTNVAGYFASNDGTNNYAIIVPGGGGSVGIGTSTPAKIFHTVGTVRHASLGTASGDTTANKPVGINSSGDIIPMTYWPGGGGGDSVVSFQKNAGRDSIILTMYDGRRFAAKDSIGAGGSASPGGSNTYVQFNDASSFGGDAGMTYDKTLNKLLVAGLTTDPSSWSNFNSGNLASTTNVNPGVTVYNAGSPNVYGMNLGYFGGYGLNFMTANSTAFFWTRGVGNVYSGFTRAMTLNSSDQLSIGGGLYVGSASTAPTSTMQSGGSFATAYTGTATGITLSASHSVVNVTATGQTITLPTAASITGRQYTIKLTASGSATVATTSSQTIDGSTTYSLASQYKYVTVVSDGANWIVIANN